MKKLLFLICIACYSCTPAWSNEPDSVYLISYATPKNANHNGLHFAWSNDQQTWYSIGNEYGFVRCDYGRWGSQKRMVTPYIVPGADGRWHCVWSLNEQENRFAHVSSADLVYWGRQVYPAVTEGNNCLRPVLKYDNSRKIYTITYTTNDKKYYQLTTTDFKNFSPISEVSPDQYKDDSRTVWVQASQVTGQVYRVPWSLVNGLIKAYEQKQYRNNLAAETTAQDSVRFAELKPVEASFTIQAEKAKPVSDLLMGVFFEDINYAADGGLYAELIQNRDFEYALSDKEGRDKNWNSYHSWKLAGEGTSFVVDSILSVHGNNPHYAVLDVTAPGAVLTNAGFDGIVIKSGEKYNFSLFANLPGAKKAKLQVRLVDSTGKEFAKTIMDISTGGWKNKKVVLTAAADAQHALLELKPLTKGKIWIDVVSLFPQKTFKNRKNGLREDLAQVIADIHPRFIRFPGGCVAHGDGIANIYRWKTTIGPLETRKPMRNLWNYHQTTGLGYFEYFQFCEDIGAEPVPVLAAGVPCQNSGLSASGGGQQGGIPLNEMDEYIQDIIDLIEYANGDIKTEWGKKRAEAGHPQPFNLKYIGIGNEDLISDVFEERFTLIYNAIKRSHPEITVIGTAGPFFEGTDYQEGWEIANRLHVPMVDEHYYQSPGWFINNQEFYDSYDRSGPKVYLGEYAAHLPGRPNNLETALAEAIYLTALERNGDIVTMASYAPLLAKEGRTQWNPNLIYFNNSTVKPTVGYEVQKLYGKNSGDEYLPVSTISTNNQAARKRIGISVVRDSKTKDVIIKMVNLLPVAVNPTIDLAGISPADGNATKTVLAGKPADKTIQPVESTVAVSEKIKMELQPYSFTVIRFRTL